MKRTEPGQAGTLSPEDRTLFREAMRGVQPLRATVARADTGAPPPPPAGWARARRARAMGAPGSDTAPWPGLEASATTAWLDDDATEFLRPGHGPDLLRGLRRGKWFVGATLDLHGSTLEQMDERLERFLASCRQHGIRCVRIVHGKGHGSRTGVAVLKDAVRRRLGSLGFVQAWVQCSENDGGAGAVLALLRPMAP